MYIRRSKDVCRCVCVCASLYIYIYIYIYVCVCVCVCVCMCVCAYVCVGDGLGKVILWERIGVKQNFFYQCFPVLFDIPKLITQ